MNLPFGSVNLKSQIVDSLKELGYFELSPVQAKVIPLMLKGKNVLALSETGSGKTLAYALPIVNNLRDIGKVQAVVLLPTVALLDQVYSVFKTLLSNLSFPADSIKMIKGQNDFTRAKPDVVLTTPELFKSLLSHYPVDALENIVIDEGDMIVKDGFFGQLGVLKKWIDVNKVSFFSASLPVQDVKSVKSLLKIGEVIDVRFDINNRTIEHHIVDIKEQDTFKALIQFSDATENYKIIAFVSTKDELYKLKAENASNDALFIAGDMDKREIKRSLSLFKNADHKLLIATDYLSRGVDIPQVDCVISLSLPNNLDYYFHRAGRSGRFFTKGDSYIFYSLSSDDTVKKIKSLQRRGVSFDSYTLTGDALKKNKGNYEFKNLGKKDRAEQDILQKKIRHAVNKAKTDKVKPGYKKKVRREVEKVKAKHRKKIVMTNIKKKGGNIRDFHME